MVDVVIDLCDDSDDDSDIPRVASPVARWRTARATSSPQRSTPQRRRKRSYETLIHDEDVTVLENASNQKPRAKPKNDRDFDDAADDDIKVVKTETPKAPPLPPSPLQQVLEVFPDIQTAHAQKLLQDHKNIAANVIDALLQAGDSYPKEPRTERASATMASPGGIMIRRSGGDEEPTYNFMSASSFEPSPGYRDQSASKLVWDFPFLTKTGARLLLQKVDFHYAIAHDKIVRAITGSDEGKKVACASRGTGDESDIEVQQYKRYKAVSEDMKAVYGAQTDRLVALFGVPALTRKGNFSANPSSTRRRVSVNLSDKILIEEIAFVSHKIREWTNEVETTMQRYSARKCAIEEGSALECPCCYEQVAPDELVACQDAHLFCLDCLSNYATNKVFSNGSFGVHPETKAPALELLCFHGDGCSSGFDRFMLQKALKPKILERYDELQSQLSLEQAGLRDTIWYARVCTLLLLDP